MCPMNNSVLSVHLHTEARMEPKVNSYEIINIKKCFVNIQIWNDLYFLQSKLRKRKFYCNKINWILSLKKEIWKLNNSEVNW